jgi:hypothetical protein
MTSCQIHQQQIRPLYSMVARLYELPVPGDYECAVPREPVSLLFRFAEREEYMAHSEGLVNRREYLSIAAKRVNFCEESQSREEWR